MGLKDFMNKGDRDNGMEKAPTPEKRAFGNWLAQVPFESQDSVESIAERNHELFRKDFPKIEDFIDAVAEGWVKKKEAFIQSMLKHGFIPIVPGTSHRDLHASILAYLTDSGSWVIVGPGAFNRERKAASLIYTKIPFRSAPETPSDTAMPSGFAFAETPRVGDPIIPAEGSDAPFVHTSPVILAYMLPHPSKGALEKMQAIDKGLSREAARVNAETGLVSAR